MSATKKDFKVELEGISKIGYVIDRATVSTAIYSYMKELVSEGFLEEVNGSVVSEDGEWGFNIK